MMAVCAGRRRQQQAWPLRSLLEAFSVTILICHAIIAVHGRVLPGQSLNGADPRAHEPTGAAVPFLYPSLRHSRGESAPLHVTTVQHGSKLSTRQDAVDHQTHTPASPVGGPAETVSETTSPADQDFWHQLKLMHLEFPSVSGEDVAAYSMDESAKGVLRTPTSPVGDQAETQDITSADDHAAPFLSSKPQRQLLQFLDSPAVPSSEPAGSATASNSDATASGLESNGDAEDTADSSSTSGTATDTTPGADSSDTSSNNQPQDANTSDNDADEIIPLTTVTSQDSSNQDNSTADTNPDFQFTAVNTTASDCSCLPTWFTMGGIQHNGTCSLDPPDLDPSVAARQALPWCFVDVSSCSRPPFSVQGRKPLFRGAIRSEWDYCRAAPGKTRANCSCLPVWGYGGVTIAGECANPSNDPQGPWCLIDPTTCTGTPAGPSKEWFGGWDYCGPGTNITTNTTPATSPGSTAVNISTGESSGTASADEDTRSLWQRIFSMLLPTPTGPWAPEAPDSSTTTSTDESLEPSVTVAGCKCASDWTHAGSTVNAGRCANPDGDPVGNWCRVDVRTCEREPEKAIQDFGAWDYCEPLRFSGPGDLTTLSGCTCKAQWSLFPSALDAGAGSFPQYGCANPDADPQGPWCPVSAGSCTAGSPASKLNSTHQQYDYCVRDMPTVNATGDSSADTIPPTTASADATATSIQPTDATTSGPPSATASPATHAGATAAASSASSAVTLSGCRCLDRWDFPLPGGSRQEFHGVCANPDNDTAGDWCIVDAKTCSWHPFGRGRDGRFWDYCTPPPAPRTRSGCLCMRKWHWPTGVDIAPPMLGMPTPATSRRAFDGVCANPDNDALGPWCVVQPQTCTRGVPTGLLPASSSSPMRHMLPAGVAQNTAAFYDYCTNETFADLAAPAAADQAGPSTPVDEQLTPVQLIPAGSPPSANQTTQTEPSTPAQATSPQPPEETATETAPEEMPSVVEPPTETTEPSEPTPAAPEVSPPTEELPTQRQEPSTPPALSRGSFDMNQPAASPTITPTPPTPSVDDLPY